MLNKMSNVIISILFTVSELLPYISQYNGIIHLVLEIYAGLHTTNSDITALSDKVKYIEDILLDIQKKIKDGKME